jgi:deoxyadenosine/deoxycytidine kinase
MPERTRILLEGNIGAGKSTVGKTLKASGLFDFIEEPVVEWKSGFASNMLDVFYRDMKRWAFTFQMVTFITRTKTWQEILSITDHPRVILERSIFTDRYVFALNLHRLGVINEDEWQVYCRLWRFMADNNDLEPDCILYLRTPAKECLQRIRQRGRGEEAGIALEYLEQLEALHDEWLLDRSCAILLDGTRWWSAQEIQSIIEKQKRKSE